MEAIKWPLSENEEETLLTKLSSTEKQIVERLAGRDRTIYRKALRETKSAVLSDYKKAPPVLRPFLWDVLHRLVDITFKVTESLEKHRLRRGDYAARFRRFVGKSPRNYLENAKIELAQKIISRSRIFIGDIGGMVGYEIPSSFSRSFKRVRGYPPRSERTGTIADSSIDPRVSPNTAEVGSREIKVDLTAFWKKVHNYSREQLRDYFVRSGDVITLDHFHFLIGKAKYEGRINRRRGEELARSALDALTTVELWSGNKLPDENAIACATIGNHCRIRFNTDEAEEWIDLAVRYLPNDHTSDPLLFATVNHYRVSLLWFQRRVEKARDLFCEILPTIREHGSREFLARALQRGAEICISTGHQSQAEQLLTDAIDLEPFIDDPIVIFSAHFNLTFLHSMTPKPAAANEQLEIVKHLEKTVNFSSSHIKWLEAKVRSANGKHLEAKSLYLEARKEFIKEGPDIFTALSGLELSSLYLELENETEAYKIAKSVIPLVSRYSYHTEAIAALTILQEAERKQTVDRSIVRAALRHLDLVRTDPNHQRK